MFTLSQKIFFKVIKITINNIKLLYSDNRDDLPEYLNKTRINDLCQYLKFLSNLPLY